MDPSKFCNALEFDKFTGDQISYENIYYKKIDQHTGSNISLT